METEICREYLETNIGIDGLASKYHVGKIKIKDILVRNGIEIKKRGNQKSREVLVVSDWRIEKYPLVDGQEYIVYDPKTNFVSKDIKNEGGFISRYLKATYGLTFPTLYDRRMYYMKTGDYWWEQWLSVKSVPVNSVSVKQEEYHFIGDVEDRIGDVVSNRIRDAKTKEKTPKRIAKVKTVENGVKKSKNEIFIEKARIAHPEENLDYSQINYIDKSTPVYIIDHDLRPDGTEYGGYWQRPENHLRGSSHPDKFKDKLKEEISYKWDKLVYMFKEAHPDENIEYPPQENYKNLNSKIRYIDHDLRPDGTEYGEIWQVASEHLKGRKHPRKYHDSRKGIAPVNKKSTETFIQECKKIHNSFYDYSKTEYRSNSDNVTITCPIHGDFIILAGNHLSGHGCPKCAGVHRYNNDEFKKHIHEIHGDKYILDKVDYVNAKTKVCLICPTHGEFWITPNKLLSGHGCYECGREKLYDSLRFTRDEVVEKANLVHNNRYTYDHFTEYRNNTSMITATCPIHGDFQQTVASHLAGCGCPSCANLLRSENNKLSFDEFVERANKTHGDKYAYIGEYLGYDYPIKILCPEHGEFWQTPDAHIHGCGCQKCSVISSKSENEIYEYVKSLGFSDAEQGNRDVLDGLEIDIYIPDKCVGIEYNGLYWHSEENGKDQYYHLNKTIKAVEKNVKLLQVFEDEWFEHREVVLSKIRHILGVDNDRIKTGARKCIIRPIESDVAREFLEEWHVQGFVPSSWYYGAFYNDVLVGVMSFKYYSDKGEWELTRFATNGKYSIPGLGGKMFSVFVKENNPSVVKSFADRRWTLDKDSNLYTNIGFKLEETCKPDYRYVVGNERKHKFGFRKQILNKKYGVPLEWTEKEMCDYLGFFRIWDCGLFKYVWKKR